LNPTDRTIEFAQLDIPDKPERDIIQLELDRSSYESIVFPSKRDVRYSRLKQEFQKLEARLISNQHWYKLMMMNLCAFGQAMQGNGSSSFILPGGQRSNQVEEPAPLDIAVQPPAKRGRSSKSDDVNRFVGGLV